VDCTATDAVTPLIRQWMEGGGGVALANKRPVSGPQADFDAFTSPAAGPRFGYESTVGAGTPFVAAVRRVVAAGDKVEKIAGAFSGTLGFLSAGLEQGKPMGALVKEAHALGYTEPDPRDDLSGMDVARKGKRRRRRKRKRIEKDERRLKKKGKPV
jgi:homoserine dehydrogenase